MNLKKKPLSFALSTALLTAGGNVYAGSWAIEEVVVTAQKRAESAQDVPVAISAFSEEMVTNTGADAVGDIIAMVPGLTGTSSSEGLSFWAIRGIASNDFTVGAEPSVGTYIDDAYIGRNIHALSSFYDVSRIEVVKGPQGTLFGRNAAAGAISIITNAPEQENSAKVGVGVGNEGQREYDLVANWAASEDLAFRVAYHGTHLDGVMEDTVSGDNGGYDKSAVRLSALWNVSDELEARLTLNYAETDTTLLNASYTPLMQGLNDSGSVTDDYPDKLAFSSENSEHVHSTGANLRLTWDISDSLTLTSITDYRSFDYDYISDQDGSQADTILGLATDDPFNDTFPPYSLQWNQPEVLQESYSQEFRLNGSSGDLDWFVGASYFKELVEENQIISLLDLTNSFSLTAYGVDGDVNDFATSNGKTESLGIYGDLVYAVNEKLSLTAGIRWSEDEKDWCVEGVNNSLALGFMQTESEVCGSETWSEVTSRFVIDYALTDDLLLYASYSEGYKGGGFNMPSANTNVNNDWVFDASSTFLGYTGAVATPADGFVIETGDKVSSFDPETSKSYELGMKGSFLENKLQFNAAIFRVEFQDLQVQSTTVSGVITSNAAEAETQGIELDFVYAASENLIIMGNYTYLDADFKSGTWEADGSDLKGRNLAFAPENSYSISAAYDIAVGTGTVSLFTVYNWTDEYNNQSNNKANLVQEDYGLWNAKTTYTPAGEAWDVYASIDNIEDKGYSNWKQDIEFDLGEGIYRGMPRLWKVGFNAYF